MFTISTTYEFQPVKSTVARSRTKFDTKLYISLLNSVFLVSISIIESIYLHEYLICILDIVFLSLHTG